MKKQSTEQHVSTTCVLLVYTYSHAVHAGTTPARSPEIWKESWGPEAKTSHASPTQRKSLFFMEKASIQIKQNKTEL